MIGRRVATPDEVRIPGDYCGPLKGYVADPSVEAVFFLKPNARDADAPRRARSIQYVTTVRHRFRECRDGSLEIRESLSEYPANGGDSDGWHGYLDEGHIWRKV
jgi:hypothetical protein